MGQGDDSILQGLQQPNVYDSELAFVGLMIPTCPSTFNN